MPRSLVAMGVAAAGWGRIQVRRRQTDSDGVVGSLGGAGCAAIEAMGGGHCPENCPLRAR
ncbi:hypothetical protein GCM10011410_18490 [Hoyosella rhizosphaerae]|uniref:Uncharacterized protein n=1 Tax=Hoyosella rhizosphaerae TaxID=1755582 RepID=A0A916UAE8_9ACTN|nr:hypothetical protein GCM10011410_18490 [Hoyosella rhizosphaerae]